MGRRGAQLFWLMLAVALPPLVALAIVEVAGRDVVASLGPGTSLAIAAGLTVVWAGIVTVMGSRLLDIDARGMLEVAERGEPAAAERQLVEAGGEVRRRLSAALDERNRQIAELARQARQAPINQDAATVAHVMAAAARSIAGDETWTIAIMRAAEPESLAGVYGAAPDEVTAIEEVHRWASTLEAEPGDVAPVRYGTGPWGAFVAVEVARSDEIQAVLMAPWEGRPAPTPAERELLGLVGQHAGMALEHALIYARVRRQAEELDRLATVQADFLRAVSHDLQSPLTSIRALAAEVAASPALDPAARDDLGAMVHQADRLGRMVVQLLTMSRLEAGVLTPASEVFRVEPIIERTWKALRIDRPFTLRTESGQYLAVGDADRFEQALWAILGNAVKYSPDASPISVTVAPVSPELLAVAVTDAGRGMSPETQARAFDQFFRSTDARAAVPDGSGIGLYTARGLLRAMGGDVTVSSRLAGGTTLTVLLPAEATRDPE